MAFNFRYTRYSAFCQLILGGLCIIFGIADRACMYNERAFHTKGVIAIWMGAWFLTTGALGFFATQHNPNTDRPNLSLVSTYLAFSIVATVFAGVMMICYGIGIAIITNGSSCSRRVEYKYKCSNYPYNGRCGYQTISKAAECRTSAGLGGMIIIFAIAEFGVTIWACVSCCMAFRCCDTSPQTQGQIIYLQAQGGPVAYVMTQGPNGMPVAVPAMTGGQISQVPNQAGPRTYVQQYPQGAMAMPPMQQVQSVPRPVAQQPASSPQPMEAAPTKCPLDPQRL